jgi:hypothetical protein
MVNRPSLCILALALPLVSPMALASSDDRTISIEVPNITAPLQILSTASFGTLRIAEQSCTDTAYTFKLTGARFYHTTLFPDFVEITLGRDWQHACYLNFDDNGSFWHNQIQLAGSHCIGGWHISHSEFEHIFIAGE